jgi:hypothetical protein
MSEDRGSALSFNRRRFMKGAGVVAGLTAAGGAGVLLDPGAAEASEIPGEGDLPLSKVDPAELVEPGEVQGDTVAGVVVEEGADSILVHPTEESPIKVNVLPGANLTIEGRVPLTDYRLGDEVIAVGERRGDEFVAKGITVVFRLKEVTILARRGRTLQTSDGEIVLLPWVKAEGGIWNGKRFRRVTPDALKPGDEILAVGMVNQRSETMRANTVAIPARESLLGP